MRYKYMRDNLEDTYGFLELQDKILEIMVDIDKLCMENDIDYCLMGGSALGAKRHKGFIPWDDDLDIFMTLDNYERFRNIFLQKGNKAKYYLQEFGTKNGMVTISKIRANNTTYIEELLKDWDMHHGIYIDIFILHNCPNNKLKQLWQFFWAKYVITKGMSIKKYNRAKGIRKIVLNIADMLPEKFLINFGLKQVYRYRNVTSDYFCNFIGKAVFKNAIYKKEWFIPTEHIDFEKVKLKVPVKLHEFLKERFGDYMQIPPKERIKWEQHAEKWDTKKDFREYVRNIENFKDEDKLL